MYDWNGSQEYEVVEGTALDLQAGAGGVRLALAGRPVRLQGGRTARPLQNGEYLRALLRRSGDGSAASIIALQRCGHADVEYTGPRVTVHFAIIAAMLLMAGLYYGIWWLVCLAGPIVILRLLFSMQETASLRRFEAYCRTSPIGSLRP